MGRDDSVPLVGGGARAAPTPAILYGFVVVAAAANILCARARARSAARGPRRARALA